MMNSLECEIYKTSKKLGWSTIRIWTFKAREDCWQLLRKTRKSVPPYTEEWESSKSTCRSQIRFSY
jgi:hypothetical protein